MTSGNIVSVPTPTPIHICYASRNEYEEQLKWAWTFGVDLPKIPVPVEPKEIDVLELLADKNSVGYFEKDGDYERQIARHDGRGKRAKTLYKGSPSKPTCGRRIEKRHRHHAERVAVRAQIASVLPCEGGYEDTDVFFDASLENDTYTYYNEVALFGPVLKCVGLNWEEAYNQIASRHPGRKGWEARSTLHRMMDPHEWAQSYRNGFEVDDDGIVRLKQDQPKPKVVVNDLVQAKAWVGSDRCLGQVGSRLFWFEKSVKRIKVVVYGGYYHKDHESFPQGRPLTRREIAKFNSFSEATRNEILAMSPVAHTVK